MVEPITIMLAATTLIGLLTKGIEWLQNKASTETRAMTPLSVTTQMYHRPALVPSSINEDIRGIEYESSKTNKKSLSSYESNDDKSSSNSSSTISVIFVIIVILGVMAFIVYRKRNKLKENEFNFQEIESPPSPRTTQMNFNQNIV